MSRQRSWVAVTPAVIVSAIFVLATIFHLRHATATVASPVLPGRAVVMTATARPAPTSTSCHTPAPTTAAGYTSMFAALDPHQWGAADVSISVPLPDGRDVWLYGDTLQAGRFQHSTAIVQTGGCLHVSHAGAQLLPNDDARHIYWIEAARTAPGDQLLITARAITLTGAGAWDFADAGYSRTALVDVDQAGNLSFTRWTATLHRPALPASPLTAAGRHHYTYARHTHPELHLTDGRLLVTTCQNWDDGTLHPLADYRPIFTEATP